MTSFEPEALCNLIEGLEFHKFYFDNGNVDLAFPNEFNADEMKAAIVLGSRYVEYEGLENETD